MTKDLETPGQDDSIADDNQDVDTTEQEDTQDDGSGDEETGETSDETSDDKTDESGSEGDETDDASDDALAAKDNEIGELRQMVREQRRAIADLEESLKQPQDGEEESGDTELDEEALAARKEADDNLFAARKMQLNTYLESMRLSDKFGDVDDVVTSVRWDDMIESWADTWLENNPNSDYNRNEVIRSFEAQIWQEENPYRTMYSEIKKVHPDYTNKGTKTPNVPKLPTEKTAPSVNSLGAGRETSKTGWNAARIDALPEDQLSTVPKDVYDKYMKGQLK